MPNQRLTFTFSPGEKPNTPDILSVTKKPSENQAPRNKQLRYFGLFLQITASALLITAHIFVPVVPFLLTLVAGCVSAAGFIAAKTGSYFEHEHRLKTENEKIKSDIHEFENRLGIPRDKRFHPKQEENTSQRISPYAKGLSYISTALTVVFSVLGSPFSAVLSLFGFFFTYLSGNIADQDKRNERRNLEDERSRLAIQAIAEGKVIAHTSEDLAQITSNQPGLRQNIPTHSTPNTEPNTHPHENPHPKADSKKLEQLSQSAHIPNLHTSTPSDATLEDARQPDESTHTETHGLQKRSMLDHASSSAGAAQPSH